MNLFHNFPINYSFAKKPLALSTCDTIDTTEISTTDVQRL